MHNITACISERKAAEYSSESIRLEEADAGEGEGGEKRIGWREQGLIL